MGQGDSLSQDRIEDPWRLDWLIVGECTERWITQMIWQMKNQLYLFFFIEFAVMSEGAGEPLHGSCHPNTIPSKEDGRLVRHSPLYRGS